MPSNVRKFCASFIFAAAVAGASAAQTQQASPAPVGQQPSPVAPTSGDVMRDRISKSKAYIAVRNYSAAIYELENIRRETSDASVNAVANVLLMNSYLEQGDYKRAGEFLTQLYNQQKTTKPGAAEYYAAVSAQAVKSARNQIERYRALGLTVADRNLPLEAVNDIERMRETLELVVVQAKEMTADKAKSAAAMTMLEEATNTRSALARDDYDARRWRDEVADSRERLANSRSVITNAVDGTTTEAVVSPNAVVTAAVTPAASAPASAAQNSAPERQPAFRPVTAEPVSTKADAPAAAKTNAAVPAAPASVAAVPTTTADGAKRNRVIADVPNQNAASAKTDAAPAGDAQPLEVGSLVGYATKQSAPIYPSAAKIIRAAGVVKVDVTINEAGDVAAVDKASGPPLLQAAAKDAIRKWKFRPFTRGGQPVKATGFISFNFNL